MIRKGIILFVASLALNSIVSASNYYVSSSGGNDNSNGRSESSAWKTIEKVNRTSFSPGDSVFFLCGDVWRETLTIPSSGNSGSYLYFGSYGSGSKPKIYGSNTATWTNYGGNVWQSVQTFTDPYAGTYQGGVYFEKSGKTTWGHAKKSSIADLAAEYDWTWSSSHIYVYAPSDPSTRYDAVEINQRDNCIELNNRNYVTIDNIDIRYSKIAGIKEAWPFDGEIGLEVKYCNVSYIGIKNSNVGYGIECYHSEMNINHNTVSECGRRGISSHVQDADVGARLHDLIIEYNTVFNCYHAGISTVSDIDGAVMENAYVRYNIVYDDLTQNTVAPEGYPSLHYAISGKENSVNTTLININYYCNISLNSTFSSVEINSAENTNVYNNVFYGINPNSDAFSGQIYLSGSTKNCSIKNNIFYNNNVFSHNYYWPCIYSTFEPDKSSIDIDYNIYYNVDKENMYFNLQGSGGPFYIDELASYKSVTGWDSHSIMTVDPQMVSPTDMHLLSGSPAVGAGIAVPQVTVDSDGNVFYDPPNMGCYATPSSSGVPVYLRSSVENATPSLLTITYNMNLANVIPDKSAFRVMVNNVSRSVTAVNVSGSNVQLTLSGPVYYGDVITVSYTKPSVNPLQTPAGSEAGSISDQPVTNNIASNGAPVPVYDYNPDCYSGFIGAVDASSSYDLNGLPVTYLWKNTQGIPVSSVNEPVVRFLAPYVQDVTESNLVLNLSNGTKDQDFLVPLRISPYKPEVPVAQILYATGNYDSQDVPANVIDKNNNTQWSSYGDNQFVILKLAKTCSIDHIGIVFPKEQPGSSYFDLYGSKDSLSWEPLILDNVSCDFSGNYQVFVIPESLRGQVYSYVKFNGHGNSVNLANSVSELTIYGFPSQDYASMVIYPNPAADHINLSITYPSSGIAGDNMDKSSIIRIINLSGKIMYQQVFNTGTASLNLPINLPSGLFIVQLISDNSTLITGKLIVIN